MIKLYPTEEETMVVSHEWDALIERLSRSFEKPFVDGGVPKFVNGWVKDDTFRLSIRIRRQHAFMPIVEGKIDPTSKGSIVYLRYSLFPGTRFLLTFWTVVLPLLAIAYVILDQQYLVAGVLVGSVILIHIIARANFRLHVKTTRNTINKILN